MKIVLIIIWLLIAKDLFAQREEDHAELLAVNEEEVDAGEAELLSRANNVKININSATREQLLSLGILSEVQVQNLYDHIEQYGTLLNKYELQAIKGFDMELIRKLLQYISVEEIGYRGFRNFFHAGSSMILFRYTPGWFLEKDSSYDGAMSRMMTRFQFNSSSVRTGLLIEKDPGERSVCDHISFHFENRIKNGLIKKIILGDFTASFGQGLIQWQGYGFGRGGDVQTVQKPAASIASFHGSSEFNFHRGIAVELHRKRLNAYLFASYKKLDGNLDPDTLKSISTGGFHRTSTELANRKISTLFIAGASIHYSIKKGKVSFNAVGYSFGHPYYKRSLPYNLYAINNDTWSNLSIDHQFTFKNLHVFGETAIDHRLGVAVLQGAILSLGKHADISIVYRNISPAFQSMYSRSFTENTAVNNEKGIYVNYSYKWRKMLFNVIADQYSHPWAKFSVDGPSSGALYSFQMKWDLSRSIELINRFRIEENQNNQKHEVTNQIVSSIRYSFRSHLNFMIDKKQQFRFRAESLVLNKNSNRLNGFVSFMEYHRTVERLYGTVVCRIQFNEVDDFDSRIYAFERDVTYGMSIPFFTGRSIRYFFVLQSKPSPLLPRRLLKDRSMTLSFKWSQSLPLDHADNSNRKSELKFQCIIYNHHK